MHDLPTASRSPLLRRALARRASGAPLGPGRRARSGSAPRPSTRPGRAPSGGARRSSPRSRSRSARRRGGPDHPGHHRADARGIDRDPHRAPERRAAGAAPGLDVPADEIAQAEADGTLALLAIERLALGQELRYDLEGACARHGSAGGGAPPHLAVARLPRSAAGRGHLHRRRPGQPGGRRRPHAQRHRQPRGHLQHDAGHRLLDGSHRLCAHRRRRCAVRSEHPGHRRARTPSPGADRQRLGRVPADLPRGAGTRCGAATSRPRPGVVCCATTSRPVPASWWASPTWSGSRPWPSRCSDEELADVVDQFERLAYDVVVAGGGRVVKMIGDEVMFVGRRPVAAAQIALGLADASRDAAGSPTCGWVSPSGRCSSGRATSSAPPSTWPVGPPPSPTRARWWCRRSCGRSSRPHELHFKNMRPRYLKHIGRVTLSVLRHADDAPVDDPGDDRRAPPADRARSSRERLAARNEPPGLTVAVAQASAAVAILQGPSSKRPRTAPAAGPGGRPASPAGPRSAPAWVRRSG